MATVLVVACTGDTTDDVNRADPSLFDYDASVPVELEEARTVTMGSLLLRYVTFPSPLGGEVSAVITEPIDQTIKAGVILMHGLPGGARDMVDWGAAFACAGVVGIAVDAPFARWENRFREPSLTFSPQDAEEQVQLNLTPEAWDDQMIWLSGHLDIDVPTAERCLPSSD